MTDFENLRTASLYINNQLLSRGLLRDGRSIDFASPGDHDYELPDTMARIMAVVNDLILRRDRDAEHRESLSTALRTLRADSLRQSDNITRLHERYTEAQRKVNIAEAEEASLKAQLKAAEASIHKLKDEAARTKKLVAETRAACANEVRKRDRHIESLKKAVTDAGRARGERKSAGIMTIQVTGEFGRDDAVSSAAASTMDDGYDLRQETNSFLAQLAKGLSEENETLLALVHKTNSSLKHMSGWDKSDDDGVKGGAATTKGDGHAIALPGNAEDLATDMDSVLGHLRTMLTNPSFVPLEEVVVREEEIFRLRDGWEKMETRWREAVHLIDSWRRRMAADGRPVDMEELKMGLRLSPIRLRNVQDTAQAEAFKLPTLREEEDEEEDKEEEAEEEAEEEEEEEEEQRQPSPAGSLHLVPAEGYGEKGPGEYDEDAQDDLDDSDLESSIFQDDIDDIRMDDLQASEPNVEIFAEATANDEADSTASTTLLPPPPKITPLEETHVAGNRKPAGTMLTEKSRKRPGTVMEKNDNTDEDAEAPTPPPHRTLPGQSPQKKLKVSLDAENENPASQSNPGSFTNSHSSLDSILFLEPSRESTISKASSRTTANSGQSEASSKGRATPAPPTRSAARAARQAVKEKQATPARRPVTRQRTTRATAATTSSSARTAPSSKAEPSRSRPAPTSSSAAAAAAATTEMPPPPRPTRAARASPAVQAMPAAQTGKKTSPTEKPPAQSTTAATTSTTSTTSLPPSEKNVPASTTKRPPESPVRSSPTKSSSRLPLPRNAGLLPQAQQSPVTVASIAAKLAASEREANAARVRAKLKAARLGKPSMTTAAAAATEGASTSTVASTGTGNSGTRQAGRGGDPSKRDRDYCSSGSGSALSLDESGVAGKASSAGSRRAEEVDDDDGDGDDGRIHRSERAKTASASPQKKSRDMEAADRPAAPTPRSAAGARASPAKDAGSGKPRKREPRSRAEKVASRRRSTLNPWELQSLIAGEVVPPPTPKMQG